MPTRNASVLSTKLPSDTKARFLAAAKKDGKTPSKLVSDLVAGYLAAQDTRPLVRESVLDQPLVRDTLAQEKGSISLEYRKCGNPGSPSEPRCLTCNQEETVNFQARPKVVSPR